MSYQCPKCGAELTRREGKYGVFYSCSNYPSCDYRISEKKLQQQKSQNESFINRKVSKYQTKKPAYSSQDGSQDDQKDLLLQKWFVETDPYLLERKVNQFITTHEVKYSQAGLNNGSYWAVLFYKEQQ